MQSDLDFFRKLIPDREKTVKEGQIKPKKGMDPEYDKALADIATTEERLEQYLYKQQRKLNSKVEWYFLIICKFGNFRIYPIPGVEIIDIN
jgi:hypothetical protein